MNTYTRLILEKKLGLKSLVKVEIKEWIYEISFSSRDTHF